MTKGEFAAHRGVRASAVSNWVKRGLLVEGECPETGRLLVDVRKTEARLNAKLDPGRGRPTKAQAEQAQLPIDERPSPPRRGDDLADVRTDLIRAQTRKAELDNARRAGELVPVEAFAARAQELGRITRERMHSIVRSNSERLASDTDPRSLVAWLTEEIDRTFDALADQVGAGQLVETSEAAEIEDPELAEAEAAALAEAEAAD